MPPSNGVSAVDAGANVRYKVNLSTGKVARMQRVFGCHTGNWRSELTGTQNLGLYISNILFIHDNLRRIPWIG